MIAFTKKFFEKTYDNLKGEDFRRKYETTHNAILLDVRTAEEFSNGNITRARNINYMSPSFTKTIKTLDKNKVYFVYCKTGIRSRSACNELRKLGLEAYNLNGGINAWKD